MDDTIGPLVETRRSLHGIAELVLAGPQYAALGDIRLRVVDGGISRWSEPGFRVGPSGLLTPRGNLGFGSTYRTLARAAGLEARDLSDVYAGGPGIGADDLIEVDVDAAETVFESFRIGDDALATFAPEAERVVWPEHFDVAISLDRVNYGMSPGDEYQPEPYAYVGPWTALTGDFWNAPFGAALRVADLGGADAVADFFDAGRRLAAAAPEAQP